MKHKEFTFVKKTLSVSEDGFDCPIHTVVFRDSYGNKLIKNVGLEEWSKYNLKSKLNLSVEEIQ